MATSLVLIIAACSEYGVDKIEDPPDEPRETGTTPPTVPSTTDTELSCAPDALAPEEVGVTDACSGPPKGGFTPVVEWAFGPGESCRATVAVGDVDNDGFPEIVANITGMLPLSSGDLVMLEGDGTLRWRVDDDLGFGSSPALADIDGDGVPDIVAVREYAGSLLGAGDYTAVAFDRNGNEVWESAHFVGDDFDYATAPAVSDMDHDGHAEVVVGRVILNGADGTTRGVGAYGRGSYGSVFGIDESAVPAIADLDLDGVEEVIVGNAWYNADGVAVWYDPSADDGMIGIANLDDDPEGEIVASSFNTVRVIDTNGRVLWGPLTIPSANIVSPSAIEDIDLDGYPEIVVAGGNNVYALNHDGTTLWTARATDMSGASGASVFDFEGDGQPEVVYIDEVQMIAFDGLTGAVKFYSSEHASDTMMDYPVIADVDNDNNAEIVVCHANYGEALSVYGDRDASWAPGRKVWNQHAYSISNVNDDLTVPQTAVQNFTTFNSWHSTLDRVDGSPLIDLAADVVDVCLDDCDEGTVLVSFRLLNRSESAIDVGTPMAVYARRGSVDTLLGAVVVPDLVAGGWSSPSYTLEIAAEDLAGADALVVVADDNGTTTFLTECTETNNAFVVDGPFCD